MKIVDAIILGNSVKIAFDDNSIHIYNAYEIKDDLKLRGYRFDPEKKTWYLNPSDIEKEMASLNSDISSSLEKSDVPLPDPAKRGTPEGSFPESYTVVELRSSIEKALSSSIPGTVWIRGVIASEIKNYKWFSYFDLKDEDENIEIFFNVETRNSNMEKVLEKLKESGVSDHLEKELPVFIQINLKVSTKGHINVRLELLDILPEYTRSKLKGKLDITIERLKKEKIYDLQKELLLPKLIKNVALITSEQGTSVKDIMAGLHPNENRFNIYFVDSRMEGNNAIDSIVSSIDFLESHPNLKFDCILIARGGGSEQSLSVFNEYEICRKVCLSKIPVITAIGHEKDLSAVELCSYLTPVPSTPSGVGKFLSQRFTEQSTALRELIAGITSKFYLFHKGEMEKITSIGRKDIRNYVFHTFEKSMMKIRFSKENLLNSVRNKIIQEEMKLNMKRDFVELNDPVKILERGFTLTLDKNDKPITSLKKFRLADIKKLKFFDGETYIEERRKDD